MPAKTKKPIVNQFMLGGYSALEGFEIELIRNRDLIEADPQPTLEVVIDLLHRLLEQIENDPRGRKP
jgi:hypothetical protein